MSAANQAKQDHQTRIEVLKRLFASFRQQQREVAEAILTDDFTFTSPYDNAIDKAAYFAHCWPNAGLLSEQSIERIGIEDEGAYVTYRASTAEGMSFRNTEYFRFAGERIAAIEVYFGAAYHHGSFARMP